MERTGLLLVVGLLLAACSDDTGSSQDGAVADLFGTDGVLRDGTGLHDGLPTDGHAGDGAAGDASSTDGPSIADGAPPDTKPPVTGGPCINPVPPSQKPCASSPTAS